MRTSTHLLSRPTYPTMPHTGTPPSIPQPKGQGSLGGVGRVEYGPGPRFVPGVTAGICRRPDDRPKAETYPPNASMNVCLVNSGATAGVLALGLFAPLPRKLELSRRAYRTTVALFAFAPPHLDCARANCTPSTAKMEG